MKLRLCLCAGAVRASSIFPIMSVGLLFLGGLCVAASEFYRSRHNVILSAGIFFVSAGLFTVFLLEIMRFRTSFRGEGSYRTVVVSG